MDALSGPVRLYGRALAELAAEQNVLAEVIADLQKAQAVFAVPEMEAFLAHPLAPKAAKLELIDRLFRGRVSAVFHSFLHVVVSRRRERSIRGILRAGLHACLELAGVEVVQVTTAVPLSPEEQEMARKQLATALGKPVHPEFQVNPGLLGGIIIRRGEQLLDASLLGILRRIGESLAAQPGLSLTPNP